MDYSRIFEVNSEAEFSSLALEIFQLQYHKIPVYQEFCDYLKITPEAVRHIEEIPFLPIELFKYKRILPMGVVSETYFSSSGTTANQVSKHYIADVELYKMSFRNAFEKFYGEVESYCILALLPSYLERNDSSLVYMVDDLISRSKHPHSGFYLDDYEALAKLLIELKTQNTPVILFGVSFALLDMAQQYPMSLPNTIVIETGGMKGRRKEIIRAELHNELIGAWGLRYVHSEYGPCARLRPSRPTGVSMKILGS